MCEDRWKYVGWWGKGVGWVAVSGASGCSAVLPRRLGNPAPKCCPRRSETAQDGDTRHLTPPLLLPVFMQILSSGGSKIIQRCGFHFNSPFTPPQFARVTQHSGVQTRRIPDLSTYRTVHISLTRRSHCGAPQRTGDSPASCPESCSPSR